MTISPKDAAELARGKASDAELAGVDDWHNAAWMQTYTGRAFRPWRATIDDIDAADIAHSLAMQCRYNGHVRRFYSVAEHCVLMSRTFDADTERELALWALLHDGAEAYIGDMVRPLKITDAMQPYRDLDHHLTALIAQKYDLTERAIPREVKDADNRILLDERAVLLGDPAEPWVQDSDGTPLLGVTIECWTPEVAEYEFLRRLDELDGGRW